MPSKFKLQYPEGFLLSTPWCPDKKKTENQRHQLHHCSPLSLGRARHPPIVREILLQQQQRWLRRPPDNHYYAIMSNTDRHKSLYLLIVLNVLLTSCFRLCSSLTESQILLTLKDSLSNSTALANWEDRTPPCSGNSANWNGVLCYRGNVFGLQLEDMGLQGIIDFTILKELKEMRTLSLMRNSLEGPMPDLKQLGGGLLRTVYLSINQFSGEIPADAFDGLDSLRRLRLADNQFSGPIPESLARLPKLVEMKLENNKFQGPIPDFEQKGFESFNVSNNALFGPVPHAFRTYDPSCFIGNIDLCGEPTPVLCPSPSPSPSPSPNASPELSPIPPPIPSPEQDRSKLQPLPISPPAPPPDDDGVSGAGSSKNNMVIASAATASVMALAAIVLAICVVKRKKDHGREREVSLENPPPPSPPNIHKKVGIMEAAGAAGHSSPRSTEAVVGGKKPEIKLTFVRDDVERFDLHDLLRASAEILGSGCFGSSYKASLSTGAMMVVKRFKQMNNVGREEFQEHMRRLGRLRHPNLLPLVAYYYRKEEKLLVHEFVQKRSLAVNLHGHQALGQPSLDWPSRLKIVKGVAKGLQYLYKELPSLIAPHGHLKSSNVLLNESLEPLLADYGLIPVMNLESAQELMTVYKSPESLQLGRITKKTDVWALGILILEIMTGKFPENFLKQGKKAGGDLASWVKSVLADGDGDRCGEVCDKEMGDTRNGEGEMAKLLKIGLACSEQEVEKRLDLKEAIERIDEVRERDGDDDFYSSYASDADIRSSRGKSDDFIFS